MTEQTPGEAFAEWIGAQFAPKGDPSEPAPVETPSGPRPDPSQGGHGTPARPRGAGAQHLIDLIYEHNRPEQPTGGWHDVI